jgi:hypothetical protein
MEWANKPSHATLPLRVFIHMRYSCRQTMARRQLLTITRRPTVLCTYQLGRSGANYNHQNTIRKPFRTANWELSMPPCLALSLHFRSALSLYIRPQEVMYVQICTLYTTTDDTFSNIALITPLMVHIYFVQLISSERRRSKYSAIAAITDNRHMTWILESV